MPIYCMKQFDLGICTMKRVDVSGIYAIEHTATFRRYIGSSKSVHRRWVQHRRLLRQGRHHSPYLQLAWAKYGESSFRFIVMQECPPEQLLTKEQHCIDMLDPVFNAVIIVASNTLTPELEAKRIASIRATAAAITHCSHGHEYSESNTYRNGSGDRICRTCNRERVARIYASETPEQTAARLEKSSAYHQRNRIERLAAQRDYTAAHKDEKRAYDVAHRDRINVNRRQRMACMTADQKVRHLALKRQSYHHCKI